MLTPFKEISHSFSIESFAHPSEQTLPSSFSSRGEFHNFIELCYVKSGTVEFVIKENTYVVERGTLIFFKPLYYHKTRCVSDTASKVYNLSFKIKGALPDGIYDKIFSLDIRSEEKFLSAFYKARDFIIDNADDDIGRLAAYELQSLIVDLCKRPYVEHKALSTPTALTYRAVVDLMERNVRSNITLDYISKSINISRSYLKALFQKHCDLSPKEYYRKLRLRESINLLAEGLPIAKISELMNFSYPNNFTEFFKNETGMSPTEYRALSTDFLTRS